MSTPRFAIFRGPVRQDGAWGLFAVHDGGPMPRPFAVTLERTYLLAPQRCCHRFQGLWLKVPPGSYTCPRDRYAKGGYETYALPVAHHTEIKFHKANVAAQLDGCPGVGERFHDFDLPGLQGPGIAESGPGFEEFMRLAGDAPEIRLDVYDPPTVWPTALA